MKVARAIFGLLLAGLVSVGSADPVREIQQRIDRGDVELSFDSRWGYLPAVLEAFDIPRSSQLLVFSKTSAQFQLISPRRPRAIYFNDSIYVGWVQHAPVLEISAVDRGVGAVFYTLHQIEEDRPQFIADNGSCLQCHESAKTLGVPGHLTRSVFPGPDGLPHYGLGTLNVDQSTPISERWGGWFITGEPPTPHRGNAVGTEEQVAGFEAGALSRDPAEFFDPVDYLTPYSDPVAHLVLAHQTQVHNAMAKAGIEARAALAYRTEMTHIFGEPSMELQASVKRRIEGPAERLASQLLMLDEALLPGSFVSSSGFAGDFEHAGKRDSDGQNLRELDLKTRVFRYPCSFLIQSEAFATLPRQTAEFVVQRMRKALTSRVEADKGLESASDIDACLSALDSAIN